MKKPNITQLVRQAAIKRNEYESRRSKTAHRAKFLTLKDEIQELVEKDKFPAQFVWKILKDEGIINCNYRTFLKYCKDYFYKPEKKNHDTKINRTQISDRKNQGRENVIKISNSSQPQQFHFNPNPNKKDLL